MTIGAQSKDSASSQGQIPLLGKILFVVIFFALSFFVILMGVFRIPHSGSSPVGPTDVWYSIIASVVFATILAWAGRKFTSFKVFKISVSLVGLLLVGALLLLYR